MKKIAFLFFSICCFSNSIILAQENTPTNWTKVNEIIKATKLPAIPTDTIDILKLGAVPDGKTMTTKIINQAIKNCSSKGGGVVLIPDGTFLTGAIHLLSNVELHLADHAILNFSTNPKDYLPLVQTRWEGNDCFNYSPLIYADKQMNIAVTGKGKLNGQGDNAHWWPWKGREEYGYKKGQPSQLDAEGRPLLTQWDNDQVPVEKRQMGPGHYLRPQFVNFMTCKNVRLADFTIENSPFWVLHPVLCQNVLVKGITINSMGPNSDGCDPESCINVRIEDCTFNNGDDCIALKSGRNFDGRRVNSPIENVYITNCKMKNGHGGVVLGSEISGGCKNIFVENCQMNSPELDRAIRIKTNTHRGGTTQNVFIRNITVGQVKEAVVKINCNYDSKEGLGEFYPLVKDVYISNMTSEKANYGLIFSGVKGENCIQDINISNCSFKGVEHPYKIQYANALNFSDLFINGIEVKLKKD